MNTKKVAAEYRMSQWAQVIQARLNSGQNITDYCQAAGINRNSFFYWQRKLREATCTELAKMDEPKNIIPSGWMQLKPAEAQIVKEEELIIEINGVHITVNAGTDPELLRKICRTLRSL